MTFKELSVGGAYSIDVQRIEDERGFFTRLWSREELGARQLPADLAQVSMSFNRKKGTLRGMHMQVAPHEEAKLVRCARGAIFDVVLDLRPSSPTFMKWARLELSAANGRMMFVPFGCAHGFQTLDDNTEVEYHISESYHPESARGFRWNDPAFGIVWPLAVTMMSERDRTCPDFVT